MRIWIFLLLVGCQASLVEQLPRQEAVLGTRISQGMSREEIRSILGPPTNRLESPFGSESWIYAEIKQQITYCNGKNSPRTSSLYLFDSDSIETYLLFLHFERSGKLESFSYNQLGLVKRVGE